MILKDIQKRLNLNVICVGDKLINEVTGGYASDLLSDVLANAEEGNLWITLQIHPNIIAVASAKNLSGILLVNGRMPEQETIKKAAAEEIPVLSTDLPTFEVVGKLYELGISGKKA